MLLGHSAVRADIGLSGVAGGPGDLADRVTAAFVLLLARRTGQNRNPIGLVDGDRAGVLAVHAGRARTVAELIAVTRRERTGAAAHAVRLGRVVDGLASPPDLSRHPLYQAGIRILRRTTVQAGGVTVAAREVAPTGTPLDIELVLDPAEPSAWLLGDDVLFTAESIAELADQFRVLLSMTVAGSAMPVAEISLNTARQEAQLLDWSVGPSTDQPDGCLHYEFAAQAARSPDEIAVVSDGARIAYRELEYRANQLAHQLRERGIGPEVRVGVCLRRSVDLLVALFGVLKAGGVYVPVDLTMSPPERTRFVLSDARCAVVVTESTMAAELGTVDSALLLLDDKAARSAHLPRSEPPRTVQAGNAAYVMYTSGSSGRPKGVVVDHRSLLNYLRWVVLEYVGSARGGAPVFSSIAFDLTVPSLFGPLLCGQTVFLAKDDADFDDLVDLLETHRPFAFAKLTPTHFELLGRLMGGRLAGLATCIAVGGEALPGRTAGRWFAEAPDVTVKNEYGPTEGTVGNVVFQLGSGDDRRAMVPIGRPIPNTEAYVLDDALRPVPPGVIGELFLGGLCVARGYIGRPALTAAKFVPHPFRCGERLYRTGDLARWLSDGQLDFLGRLDEQVKINGFRIELGEIEAVLAQHSAVDDCTVTVGLDRERRYLVADVLCTGVTPSAGGLTDFLHQRLPYYMVPASIRFHTNFPTTPHGKLDRRQLPVSAAADDRLAGTPAVIEPVVVDVWQDALGTTACDPTADFLASGGDSVTAVRLVHGIQVACGVELSVRDVFENPTPRRLAIHVQSRQWAVAGE
jgi:amino acid adenylation domain-containing protein